MNTVTFFTMPAMAKVDIPYISAPTTDKYNLIDQNLNTAWIPDSTGTKYIELQLNPIYSDKITTSGNRDFETAAPGWFNIDFPTYDETSDLSIVATASGQQCKLSAISGDFVGGHSYTLRFDCALNQAGFDIVTYDSIGVTEVDTVVSGVINGTEQYFTFTATAFADELRIKSTTTNANADFDNFSIIETDNITVNGYAILIRNYINDYYGLNIDFYQRNSRELSWDYTGGTGHPSLNQRLFIRVETTWNLIAQSYKINISPDPEGIFVELAGFWLLTERILNTRPEFPYSDDPQYYNKEIKLSGGMRLVATESNNKTILYKRKFTLVNQTDYDMLMTIYDDCMGKRRPFIYQEGNINDAVICRFTKDKPIIKQVDYQYYKATVEFETLPYIKDGETM